MGLTHRRHRRPQRCSACERRCRPAHGGSHGGRLAAARGSLFEVGADGQAAMLGLLGRDGARSAPREGASGAFTVGPNDGPAAGQAVPHLHLPLIPNEGPKRRHRPRAVGRWIVPARSRCGSRVRVRDGQFASHRRVRLRPVHVGRASGTAKKLMLLALSPLVRLQQRQPGLAPLPRGKQNLKTLLPDFRPAGSARATPPPRSHLGTDA